MTHHALHEPDAISRTLAPLARLWRSYWIVPALLMLLILGITIGLRWADALGLSGWLHDHGLSLVRDGDAMTDWATAITGANAAIATLYVSITLIVLTLAAGNLGVRLIDRWTGRAFIRATLGIFLGALAASAFFLASLDADAPPATLPHASFGFIAILFLFSLAWLAGALNDLADAVFVDRTIARIAKDVIAKPPPDFERILAPDWPDATPVRAPGDGYIVTCDIARLSEIARDCGTFIRLDRSSGDHLIEGQAYVVVRDAVDEDCIEAIHRCLTLGQTRSDQNGIAYRIRLLVEIAARALSPGINDFYTARCVVDALASIMLHQRGRLTREGQLLVEVPQVICPTASFAAIFDAPVKALRQSAAAYPAITVRAIERFGSAAAIADDTDFTAVMRAYAADIAAHGSARAETESDCDDIAAALATAFGPKPAGLRVAG
ncbi:DUF2254 family protein [Sphingomicrobium aestuariivivum]|uniref:DUF2254 family protein n=1 Tax=Sphingomicrobium aestuariivivum TaxID=1582356 RepID=UPI001FD6DD20|nr:DUF2254 family protein [Sphingomicrobium aestuariivivum]MCJ8190536.1 DUF2254 domain-containing protein [Sphingomicrobium aestuariivivum]